MLEEFSTLKRLPPYAFSIIGELKAKARKKGLDVIDFGMGNPDQPTPEHIVNKLIETAKNPRTHRYSVSRGLPRLRLAICNWYQRRYKVKLNPDNEAIACIGSKEGIAHLALACMSKGDLAIVPTPAYPVHPYGFVIAGGDIRQIATTGDEHFFAELEQHIATSWPKPKMLVVNFPNNPTGKTVDLAFFKRLVRLCRDNGMWLINDIAYADILFEGGQAPSVLQVPGAKQCAIEFFSLSKSYNMPGWRIGFACGNKQLVAALAKIKSYLDYGTFTPIQVAAIEALEGDQSCVAEICELYRKRRDVLCNGLASIGWEVEPPKATMFVWAKIPDFYLHKGNKSLDFARRLLTHANVAVSPGVGFGVNGDEHLRFALIENEHRTRQAIRNIKQMFRKDGMLKSTSVIAATKLPGKAKAASPAAGNATRQTKGAAA